MDGRLLREPGLAALQALPDAPIIPTRRSLEFGIAGDFLGQRTRLDIIWSCFVTIFACTWVVVHPNIPSERDTEWRIVGRRLKIMVYTLLVPELVLYWASKQWYAARETGRKHAGKGWTKTHGFFIGMGGFVLYKDGKALRPLDAADLEDLYELGEVDWPTVSEEDITDKSKGDYFTKSVVLIQTTWFVFQCIARGALGLGLTELELVTLGFAALSAAMYFFWWSKPLDVRRPIAIHTVQTATMQFSTLSTVDASLEELEAYPSRGEHKGITSPRARSAFVQTSRISCDWNSLLRRTHSLSSLSLRSHDSFDKFSKKLNAFSPIAKFTPPDAPSLAYASPYVGQIHRSFLPYRNQANSPLTVTSPLSRVKAWKSRSVLDLLMRPLHIFIDDIQELRYSGDILSGRGECHVSTFYAALILNLEHELTVLFLVTATLYGCIHCAAWRFNFPSNAERWLWRMSSLTVSVLPSLFGLQWWLVYKFTTRPYNPLPLQLIDRLERVFHVTSNPRVLFMLVIYLLARIALLVLPLLALRSLSSDAYVSISWTNVIPHVV